MPTPADLTGSRFQAVLIDHVAALGVTAAVALAATPFVADPTAPRGALFFSGMLYVPFFLGYKTAAEARTGRTLGKGARGLAVRTADGSPCTVRAALVRNLLLVVDWLPATYLLGLIVARRNSENRRLGDLLAGTVVVER